MLSETFGDLMMKVYAGEEDIYAKGRPEVGITWKPSDGYFVVLSKHWMLSVIRNFCYKPY